MTQDCSVTAPTAIEGAIEVAQDLVRALEHYSDLAPDTAEARTQELAWRNATASVRDLVRGAIRAKGA